MTTTTREGESMNNEIITGTYEERLEALRELPMDTMVYTQGKALFEFEKTASGLFEQMQYGKAVSTWEAEQMAKWDHLRIYRPDPSTDLLTEIRNLLRKTDQAAFLGEIAAVLHEIRDRLPEPERPESCCGDCPPIAGGGYDCTCDGRCDARLADEGTHDRIGSRCTQVGCLELHDPNPESVTVTLPRDVAIRELCDAIRHTVEYVGTETLPPIKGWSWFDALSKYAPDMADALEAADTPPEPTTATQDAPAGRVGWWRSPLLSGRHLVREVEGGWSCDENDFPYFRADKNPDAVFTPIATLPEGYVAVRREDVHYAVTVLDALDPFLDPNTERWLIRLRAAIDGSRS